MSGAGPHTQRQGERGGEVPDPRDQRNQTGDGLAEG